MKAAVFDMDGTLVDSMEYWGKTFIQKLDEESIPYPDDVLNIVTPMGVKRTCQYMCELGHPKDPDTIYREVEDTMIEQYSSNIPAKPFAMEYLKKLKEQGVKMCVLSASTHKMIEASAKKCGYIDYMEFILSCEDLGMSKSDPGIFRLVAEKLGAELADITVFDDNSIAIKTAKEAGAKTCAVYDEISAEYADEIKAVADNYIYSYKELL